MNLKNNNYTMLFNALNAVRKSITNRFSASNINHHSYDHDSNNQHINDNDNDELDTDTNNNSETGIDNAINLTDNTLISQSTVSSNSSNDDSQNVIIDLYSQSSMSQNAQYNTSNDNSTLSQPLSQQRTNQQNNNGDMHTDSNHVNDNYDNDTITDSELLQLDQLTNQQSTIPITHDKIIPISYVNNNIFNNHNNTQYKIKAVVIQEHKPIHDNSVTIDIDAFDTQRSNNNDSTIIQRNYAIRDIVHTNQEPHTIELQLFNDYAKYIKLNINDYITIQDCMVIESTINDTTTNNNIRQHDYTLQLNNQDISCNSTVITIQTQRDRLLDKTGRIITNNNLYNIAINIEQNSNNENTAVNNIERTNKRGRKRKLTSNQYNYIPLGELQPNQCVDVYGIVTRYSDIRQSAGSDYFRSINICDSTWSTSIYQHNSEYDGLTVNIFSNDEYKIPAIKHKYDIIRIHRLDIKLYNGNKLQGVYNKFRSSHVVISSQLNDSYVPYHTSSDNVTDIDNDIVQYLRQYIHTHYLSKNNNNRKHIISYNNNNINNTTSSTTSTDITHSNDYARRINELHTTEYIDLYGKVYYIDTTKCNLYIWDGTDISSNLSLRYPALRNNDITPDEARITSTNGTIISVDYCHVIDKTSLLRIARAGDFLHLRNIYCYVDVNNTLSLRLTDKSKVIPLLQTSNHVCRIVQEYAVRLEQEKQKSTSQPQQPQQVGNLQSKQQNNINKQDNVLTSTTTSTNKTSSTYTITSNNNTTNSTSIYILKHINEINNSGFFDLCCKLLYCDNTTLLVWDGSDAANNVQHASYKRLEYLQQIPAYGTVLLLTCRMDDAGIYQRYVNQWVCLRNISVNVSHEDNTKLYLLYTRKSKLISLDNNNEYVQPQLQYIKQRDTQQHTSSTSNTVQQQSTTSHHNNKKLRLISQLHHNEFIDLVVKLLDHDIDNNVLYVWDGSESDVQLSYRTLRNNIIHNNVKTPQYGTILPIKYHTSHTQLFTTLITRQWYHLKNLCCEIDHNNKLLIKYTTNSENKLINETSTLVQQRLSNYNQYVQSKQQIQYDTDNHNSHNTNTVSSSISLLLSESITSHPHTDQSITPIKSMCSYTLGQSVCKYRCHVRIVGYSPQIIEQCVRVRCMSCDDNTTYQCSTTGNDTCSTCGYNEHIVYEWSFKLLCADTSGCVPVILTSDNATMLLNINPDNLYINNSVKQRFTQQLDRLNDSNNWLDCCIFSYTSQDRVIRTLDNISSQLSQLDEAEAMQAFVNTGKPSNKQIPLRNYQMFHTKLKEM